MGEGSPPLIVTTVTTVRKLQQILAVIGWREVLPSLTITSVTTVEKIKQLVPVRVGSPSNDSNTTTYSCSCNGQLPEL